MEARGLTRIYNTLLLVSCVCGSWPRKHQLLKFTFVGWAGGALGILLSRNNKRNVVPSLM
jgi:hypothetical protein